MINVISLACCFFLIASSLVWTIWLAQKLSKPNGLTIFEFLFLLLLIHLGHIMLVGICLGVLKCYTLWFLFFSYKASFICGSMLLYANISGFKSYLRHLLPIKGFTFLNALVILSLLLSIFIFSYTAENTSLLRDDGAKAKAGAWLAQNGNFSVSFPHIDNLPDQIRSIIDKRKLTFGLHPYNQSEKDLYIYLGLRGIDTVYAFGYIISKINGIYFFRIVIGLTCILSIFALAWRAFQSTKIASIAVILFTFSMPLIWNVRMGLTESLSQALLFGGIWLLWISHEENSRIWAVVSSLFFFLALTTHLANWVILVPLFAYILVYFHFSKNISMIAIFSISFIISNYTAIVFNRLYSFNYVNGNIGHLTPIIYAVTLVVVVFLIINLIRNSRLVQHVVNNKDSIFFWIKILFGLLIALLTLYGIYFRPYIMAKDLLIGSDYANSRFAFKWFTMYLTPLGALGGTLGFLIWLNRCQIEDDLLIWIPFIGTALIFSFGMGTKAFIEPLHFWLSRRYLAVMLPTYLIFFCYFVAEIMKMKYKLSKIAAIAIFIIVLSEEIWILKPHITKREFDGHPIPVKEIRDVLPDNIPLITFMPAHASLWEGVEPYLNIFIFKNRIYPVNFDQTNRESIKTVIRWFGLHHNMFILTYNGIPRRALFFPSEIRLLREINADFTYSEFSSDKLPDQWNTPARSALLWRVNSYQSHQTEIKKRATTFQHNKISTLLSQGIYQDNWLQAESSFNLDPIDLSAPAFLHILLHRPVSDQLPPAKIAVSLNHHRLEVLKAHGGNSNHHIKVPHDLMNRNDHNNTVAFKVIDGFFCPHRLFQNGDTRQLAVQLKRLALTAHSHDIRKTPPELLCGPSDNKVMHKNLIMNDSDGTTAVSGFHDLEKDQNDRWRWTDGHGVIQFCLQNQPMNIVLKISFYKTRKTGEFILYFNDNQIKPLHAKVANLSTNRYNIPQDRIIIDDFQTIRIESETFCPADNNSSQDTRNLGIRIKEMIIQPFDSANTGLELEQN